MKLYTQASGSKVRDLAKDYSTQQMDRYMMDPGKMMSLMVMDA